MISLLTLIVSPIANSLIFSGQVALLRSLFSAHFFPLPFPQQTVFSLSHTHILFFTYKCPAGTH